MKPPGAAPAHAGGRRAAARWGVLPEATPARVLAWAMALALPLAAHAWAAPRLPADAAMLLALMTGAAVLWTSREVPDFVVGLLLLWLAVLAAGVPAGLAFGGFSSALFLLVLGVFLLSAQLAESPWLARWTAALLQRTQHKTGRALGAVLGTALLLTLVLPSPLGRAALLAPLLGPLAAGRGPRAQTALVFALMQSHTLWSTAFLTGNPLNFVLLAMLSLQTQQRFQWLPWALAACAFFAVATLGLALILAWLLHGRGADLPAVAAGAGSRPAPAPDASPEPTLTPADDAPAPLLVPTLYALLLAALLTRGWHGIDLHWAALGLALAGLALAPLPAEALKRRVDWPTLLFVATLAAWQPMLEHAGVAAWLAAEVPALAAAAQGVLWVNVLVLAAAVALLRLLLPGAPAFIVLATALLPLAPQLGLSPWVLGFVLLTLTEGFVLPHQHGVAAQVTAEARALGLQVQTQRLFAAHLAAYALRVAALLASLPWWQRLALA
jgi:di/tricarboxylate transporter